MDMSINPISSDSSLIDIEHPFRVSAGPGAGKTFWLVEHIRNVLHRSQRLGKARKVACITYTNIAVQTILSRLGTSADRVEVSTIHSFLYKHIVKPYAAFIADEYGLNINKMNGHDDLILSGYSFLNEWKIKTKQKRIKNDKEVVDAIRKTRWKFQGSELICKPDYPMKADNYAIRNDSYFVYKKMSWEKGVLHHDDVLFFSLKLIQKYPFVLTVIRAKFPYFFVDEFQDTNPIQAEILRQIGQNDTIIGIIGDTAQSIYSFQGASPKSFENFDLPGLLDLHILENRRSNTKIVQVLNHIRTDIQQICKNKEEGIQPVIIVGDMVDSLKKSKELSGYNTVHSLARDNITSNSMKREINGVSFADNLFEELLSKDKPSSSNKYRSKVVIACLKSTELAREGKFKESIKELERIFKVNSDIGKAKKDSLVHLQKLIRSYDDYKNGTLFDFYSFVKSEIKYDISDLRTGTARSFYENHSYLQLSLCVKITEDSSLHKTIHKAKGDEFDNVLLILKDETDLEFLLNPNLAAETKQSEEQRVNYVAISRAKKRFFVSVPSLLPEKKEILSNLFCITSV
jgi:DNA helicase-2/ATP-dependent DNA helicase PcrA